VETIRPHTTSDCARPSERAVCGPDRPGLRVIALGLGLWLASIPAAGGAAAAVADSVKAAASRADSPAAPPADSLTRSSADSLDANASPALPGRLATADRSIDPEGRGPRLVAPAGLTVDPFGRVVVSDAAAHRVVRYDRDGKWLDQEGALGSGLGQLRRPTTVVTLGSLGTAVLDKENRRIVSYDLLGRRLGVLVDLAAPALADQVGRVDAITLAADRGGALYVADAARDRILAFDFAGRFLREIGGFGTRSGAFRGLGALGATPRGEIVAAERGGQRVQQLDAGGRVVRAWPLAVAPGRAALSLAVDDSARVAVADGASGRLWLFDPAGRLWATASRERSLSRRTARCGWRRPAPPGCVASRSRRRPHPPRRRRTDR
jgi:hypothetical protein